jgi:hypothetical protein
MKVNRPLMTPAAIAESPGPSVCHAAREAVS